MVHYRPGGRWPPPLEGGAGAGRGAGAEYDGGAECEGGGAACGGAWGWDRGAGADCIGAGPRSGARSTECGAFPCDAEGASRGVYSYEREDPPLPASGLRRPGTAPSMTRRAGGTCPRVRQSLAAGFWSDSNLCPFWGAPA